MIDKVVIDKNAIKDTVSSGIPQVHGIEGELDEEGEEVFSFGKHKGKKVHAVLEKEPGYFGWMLNADFPLYTKKILTQIKLSKLNNKLG